jgi:hypothetical protein
LSVKTTQAECKGAFGSGNPIGGNVTTNVVDGENEPIAEWMLFISAGQFCLRACTNANSTYSAAAMCEHKLDVMGCNFVMPGTYNPPGTLCARSSLRIFSSFDISIQ